MVYYLDSSAWVKRYVKENGSDVVDSLFDATLACSFLGLIEIISTLARKGKAGYLAGELVQERISVVEQDWDYFVQIPLSPDALIRAKDPAQKYALRGADAIHLGCALFLQSKIQEDERGIIFVTSDQELGAAAQAAGFETLDPTQARTKEPK